MCVYICVCENVCIIYIYIHTHTHINIYIYIYIYICMYIHTHISRNNDSKGHTDSKATQFKSCVYTLCVISSQWVSSRVFNACDIYVRVCIYYVSFRARQEGRQGFKMRKSCMFNI